ncbi:hypothetical protein [Lentilactobacillus parabuchneri]|jgi:hypothetical protein|uniref:Uncharacterized protein n=1 Tax=Lentilactobacillus parabuchneri TaxID=152331 RepID=A0A844E9W9_9LACO|nr:hypothetical protein [Lentilactobacillus parabuchneri]MCI1922607.1 hypothetical protein [Lentilactobacillus buchneri]MCI1950697.1 hypothetical protein [Lentilactobacillus buchneri]MCI2018226.1 hypothetical protein [Lentilactobacillus buchneri]MCI2027823.1 hypothetical protein [Lentilactobacillus buchneri]MDB1104711.1 hypothetical protein [Lentilactobacillus parabuchneri]
MADMNINEFKSWSDNFIKNSQQMQGSHNYELGDVLNDKFIAKNTNSSNLDAWWDRGKFGKQALKEIDEKTLDSYVIKTTKFKSWQDMLDHASEEYVFNRLGL